MSDMQKFDDNIIENLRMFSFKDDEQFYTNGVELVPLYRVVQILEHFKVQELVDKVPYYEKLESKATPKKPKINHYDNDCTKIICPNDCGIQLNGLSKDNEILSFTHEYCPKCGQAIDWSGDE